MIVYSEPQHAEHIPVIDLEPTFCGDESASQHVVEQIRLACRETGFFYVTNHGIDRTLIDRVFLEAHRFFDLPEATKLTVRKQFDSRGYEPAGLQRLDNASPGDLKESFNFSHGVFMDTGREMINKWPPDMADFRDQLEAYYRSQLALVMHITRLIARSLDLPASYFDRAMERPGGTLRLLRYPPQPADAEFNQLGAGAHTDWGWLTLLAQDDSGGLEVQSAAGSWIRADPIPDTFVVNLGDLVSRWTNDRYHSTMHRVLNRRPERNRHSIVFFSEPEYSTRIECLPTCLAIGENAKYPSCSAGEHRMQRYHDAIRHLDPRQ